MWLQTVLIVALCAQSNALVIRSGLGKLTGRHAQENDNVFGSNVKLAIANFEGDEGFNQGESKIFKNAEDGGMYSQQNKGENKNSDGTKYDQQEYGNMDTGSVSDSGNSESHKKGHHKSGFHNTYHKDESGSNSSYFDDANDEGGQYNRDSKKGIYGNASQRRNDGFHLNSNSNSKDDARRGGYSTGGHHSKNDGGQANFNKRKYYEDNHDQGRRNAGAAAVYDQYGRLVQQHEPHYGGLNYQPHHKITVYDDPNFGYDRRDRYREFDRYYDDGLDFRPNYNGGRLYDRRGSNYDYYY